MKKQQSKTYEYHFKIDVEMEKELVKVELYKKQGSFSGLIVEVLELLFPRLENELLGSKQRNSHYQLVNDDGEIARKSVHVYLPHSLYRQLKLMHHDLNFYSIAQLIRLILRFFLELIKQYGEKVISKLRKVLKQWKEQRQARRYRIKSIRQLLHFIYQKPNISRYLTIYSTTYCPISIYRY